MNLDIHGDDGASEINNREKKMHKPVPTHLGF